MPDHKSIQTLFVMLAIAGLAGCASPGGSAPGEAEPTGDGISIQVTNDISPPSSIVVWAVAETGSRRRLGTVPTNQQRSFNYSPMTQSMQMYLVAESEGPTTGTMGQTPDKRSNLFPVLDVKSVEWTVSRQNVRLVR